MTAMGGVSPPRLRFLFVFLLVVRGCGLPPVSASCVFCCCFLVTWRGAPTDGGPLPLPSLQRESIDCISCCVGLRGGGVVRSGSRWGGGECGRKRVGRLQSQSQRRRRRRPRRVTQERPHPPLAAPNFGLWADALRQWGGGAKTPPSDCRQRCRRRVPSSPGGGERGVDGKPRLAKTVAPPSPLRLPPRQTPIAAPQWQLASVLDAGVNHGRCGGSPRGGPPGRAGYPPAVALWRGGGEQPRRVGGHPPHLFTTGQRPPAAGALGIQGRCACTYCTVHTVPYLTPAHTPSGRVDTCSTVDG